MKLRNVIIGITVTTFLLLGLGLTRLMQVEVAEQEFELKKIEIISLTPPPAPPMEEQLEEIQELEELAPPPLAIEASVPTIHPQVLAVPVAQIAFDPQLEVDLFSEEVKPAEATIAKVVTAVKGPKKPVKPRIKQPAAKASFGLGDLDAKPSLRKRGRFRWPNSVRDKVVTASVHVELNERGQIRVIDVKSLSAPAFRPTLLKFIQSSRFSVPKLKGKPVKVRYIWPLTLKKP